MRVYDELVELDYTATQRFFEQRGERLAEVGPLSAVLYQDHQPDLAQRRSAHEIELIAPKLRTDGRPRRILDLGCGTGRWTAAMADVVDDYLGLDFCEDFLTEARRAAQAFDLGDRIRYAHADLFKGLPKDLADESFDTVIVAGVLLYLNDVDAARLLLDIARVLAPKGVIYIREPLGVTQRLTLKEHFSNDLATTYSSVYRSLAEFKQLLQAVSAPHRLSLQASDALYPSDLDNRAETRQFYFLLTKSES